MTRRPTEGGPARRPTRGAKSVIPPVTRWGGSETARPLAEVLEVSDQLNRHEPDAWTVVASVCLGRRSATSVEREVGVGGLAVEDSKRLGDGDACRDYAHERRCYSGLGQLYESARVGARGASVAVGRLLLGAFSSSARLVFLPCWHVLGGGYGGEGVDADAGEVDRSGAETDVNCERPPDVAD